MADSPYRILPFNFGRLGARVLLTNDTGEYFFLTPQEFDKFVAYRLPKEDCFYDLVSAGFAADGYLDAVIDNQADKYRTKKRHLYDFTNLHMIVLTYRCNHDCRYCHASSVADTCKDTPDMSPEIAWKAVDIILQSPAKELKIEFQGGEPLLNFETLTAVVEYVEERIHGGLEKHIEFVVCTNLTLLTAEHLAFFKKHSIVISTSLDGPMGCHDANRILRNGQSSYQAFREKLESITDADARNAVSALLTVTKQNIDRLPEVVDEYIQNGFPAVFLRMLNRIGPADSGWDEVGYSVDQFITAYKAALDYIIELNLNGVYFQEILATILLTKILTPFSTGFVDLQSPAGTGIAGVIYDTNGDVFVSDEGRMLARASSDFTFRIGNVSDSWKSIFGTSKLRALISDTLIESLPGCCHCPYLPYCGTEPVKNYLENGRVDQICRDNCLKYKAIFEILFELLAQNRREINEVLWSWVTGKTIK